MKLGMARFKQGMTGLALVSVVGFVAIGTVGGGAATAKPHSMSQGALCDGADATIQAPTGKGQGPVKTESGKKLAAGSTPTEIAEYWAEHAKEAVAGHILDLGIGAVTNLIGLEGDPNAEVLAKLDQIKLQLDNIESRLKDVQGALTDLLKKFDEKDFQDRMGRICSAMIDQERLYRVYYVPMVQAAVALGDAKSSTPPTADKVPDKCDFIDPDTKKCPTPQRLAELTRKGFVDYYTTNARVLSKQVSDLHLALMPRSEPGSVLTSLGAILLHSRFLTHSQSEKLRGLYDQIRNTDALASWMLVEFDASQPGNAWVHDAQSYLTNATNEEGALPPIIPDDALIDLGTQAPQAPATATTNKPMWQPASPDDKAWFPGYGGVPQVTAVDNTISALNASGGFRDWKVPSKAQLLRLTQDCSKNPCSGSNLPSGSNIYAYLRDLDPNSALWQTVFCNQSNASLTCANAPAHRFVWSSDTGAEHLRCGYTIIPASEASRFYPERIGMLMAAKDPANANSWERIPKLPDKVPGYGLQDPRISYPLCDSYTTARLQDRTNWGVVFATRTTEPAQTVGTSNPPHDLNPTSCVDYMDQKLPTPCTDAGQSLAPRPPCAGEAPTIVGTNEPDKLTGTGGEDVIVARGGDDTVTGLGGDDVVCGGGGADVLRGGGGDDDLRAQGGDDRLSGGSGDDVQNGGAGEDDCRGGGSDRRHHC